MAETEGAASQSHDAVAGIYTETLARLYLKQGFGEPTSVAPKQVQNSLGETFDTFDATWALPQVEILFRAVTARVDVGLLSVDTARGRDHRRQRAPASATTVP